MAGTERPRCVHCGKLYKFNWDTEKMVKNCKCED